jgi:hypothetical protein
VIVGIGVVKPGCGFVIVVFLGGVVGEATVLHPGREGLLHAGG